MTVIELLEKIKKAEKKSGEMFPDFIDVEDVGESQLCIHGKWMCMPSVCGVCFSNGYWVYFTTDSERGYVSGIKKFDNEEELCDYVYTDIIGTIAAEEDEIAIKYMMKNYNYTRVKAVKTVNKIEVYRDLFDEMFYYMENDEFPDSCIEVEGITAQKLIDDKDLSIPVAYSFLVELRENPDKAKKLFND